MTAARASETLLAQLQEIGGRVNVDDGRVVVRAGPREIPADLMRRLRASKAELLATLGARCSAPSITDDWRRRLRAETEHRRRAGDDKAQAAAYAFGALVTRWHAQQRGRPAMTGACAGCGRPLGGDPFDVGDGATVHLGGRHGTDCLIAYGTRWRTAAAAGLRRMGIEAPDEWSP